MGGEADSQLGLRHDGEDLHRSAVALPFYMSDDYLARTRSSSHMPFSAARMRIFCSMAAAFRAYTGNCKGTGQLAESRLVGVIRRRMVSLYRGAPLFIRLTMVAFGRRRLYEDG